MMFVACKLGAERQPNAKAPFPNWSKREASLTLAELHLGNFRPRMLTVDLMLVFYLSITMQLML